MSEWDFKSMYNLEVFCQEGERFLSCVKNSSTMEDGRKRLIEEITQLSVVVHSKDEKEHSHELVRIRDCAHILKNIITKRSDHKSGFSVMQALWDITHDIPRNDLSPAFFAELINWIKGLEGRAKFQFIGDVQIDYDLKGRKAAILRSAELDVLWNTIESTSKKFPGGLSADAAIIRKKRKKDILKSLGGDANDWMNWRWHIDNLVTDLPKLKMLVELTDEEEAAVDKAFQMNLPFSITPYYVSLMDQSAGNRDRAIRSQVIPTDEYITWMQLHKDNKEHSCDFMLESETSPIDLITRRYPAIVILKPYPTCPQICVYCQRNWEIEETMRKEACVDWEKINAAIKWIGDHRAIHEVLLTGGDPLALSDEILEQILRKISKIPHIDIIRIGTRTPVTMPMRIDEKLALMLSSFREIGRRDIAMITHIEHPYEITLDTAQAVDNLKRAGISVYNQQVYTFFVSRRFESALLRLLLRRIGIDPYYTFIPKGKMETNSYRVPLARSLQEQKEEARLMPGLRRTDEVVFNIPGLGKNYLRAYQHRDLITLLPDGARVYEFHPWEKNLVECENKLINDMPILDYLNRLSKINENPLDYDSIWFYF